MAMEDRKVSAMSATSTPNFRKQHKPTSSLGSLYEVLADLEETQLNYLIQEMSHTGHQHIPVSQAVSAFESQNPTDCLNNVRASMLPPAPGVRRQLSKSQQGKLRLQTAFQRAPSLRQRQRQETHTSHQKADHTTPQFSAEQPVQDQFRVSQTSEFCSPEENVLKSLPRVSADHVARQEDLSAAGSFQSPNDDRKKSPAYRRIPRPEFSLPPGITVVDLLELLEAEFLSSNSQQSSSPEWESSPSSLFSTRASPSPLMLSPPSPSPFNQKSGSNGFQSLRRHASRLDMALDAERTASGAEEIGLGLLEPRPQRTVSLGSSAVSTPLNSSELFGYGTKGDSGSTSAQPVVLEGIFDVLENK